ncbi:MAG: GNAT family N-acetyltransferase [Armatimonadetes bacterium]|nr:GNAT family N-acetyltransferase [Armatimonadota bacterium]
MITCELDNIAPAAWDAFVRDHPDGTFFHQYEWLQLVRDVYGGEPHYLAAYDDGRLVGVLPLMTHWAIGVGRTLISVPFSDVGGVCAVDERAEGPLLDAAAELGRRLRVKYVDVRQLGRPLPGDFPCDLSRLVLRLDLPASADDLREGLSRNMRKKLKRAERDGLTAHEYASVGRGSQPDAALTAAIDAFYGVYSRNMRDLGAPMHSRRYFRAIAAAFPGAVLCVQVALGSTVVGAAVAASFRDTLYALCAHSLREYHHAFPSNLLYWKLLESAVARGCSTADFGRSPRGTGIYEFKKGWGMAEHQLYCTYLPLAKAPRLGDRREGLAYRAFSRLWRHVPLPVARAVGPHIFARLSI